MEHLPQKTKKSLLIAFTASLLLFVLVYLLVPILPLTFPPQEQFRTDSDIRIALTSIAEIWGVSEKNLYVLAVDTRNYNKTTNTYDSKSIAILHPETLSSASVWMPSPTHEHDHSVQAIGPPGSDLHLLSQFTPKNALERAIARNFYTKSKTAKRDKVVIVHIEPGFPFGNIKTQSLTKGELHYTTFLTYPIFMLALHADY